MPRLIDADALMKSAWSWDVECLIKQAPTIDAEPVRHGRWIPEKVCSVETKFKCSECNRKIIACNDYFGRAPEWVSNIYPYCHCGAKMRGDEDATE